MVFPTTLELSSMGYYFSQNQSESPSDLLNIFNQSEHSFGAFICIESAIIHTPVCCCSLGRLLTGCGGVVIAVAGVVTNITCCCYSQFLIGVDSDNNEGIE